VLLDVVSGQELLAFHRHDGRFPEATTTSALLRVS
jgi:hypothetical protein